MPDVICFYNNDVERTDGILNSYFNPSIFLLGSKLGSLYFAAKSGEIKHVLRVAAIQADRARPRTGPARRADRAPAGSVNGNFAASRPQHAESTRTLSPQMADLMLHQLHITILDLLKSEELPQKRS